MTVSKSQAPSSSSAQLSILKTHPHPHLHSHHLKSSTLASASVTKATVDSRSTMESFTPELQGGAAEKGVASKNPSSWDPQDDILLRHLKEVKKLGWKDISQYFSNRTPNACQFRWRRLKSGNLKSNKTAHIDVTDFPGKGRSEVGGPVETAAAAAAAPQATAGVVETASPAIPIPRIVGSGDAISKGLPSQSQPQSQSGAGSAFTHSYPKSPYTHVSSTANSMAVFPNSVAASSSNGAGSKFFKARSNSHSFSKLPNSNSSASVAPEEENIGFIPKIIVRSRRSSFAHPPALPQPTLNSSTPNLSSSLNTTLNTIKSRKNSFTSRSRRSSFNIPSNTPSRRSSLVLAPNSLSGIFSGSSASSTPKLSRRDSMVTLKKEFGNYRSSTPSFMDLPAPSIPPHYHRRASRSHYKQQLNATSHNGNCSNCSSARWSIEEDKLLSENGLRNLSIMELSILLPNRTEKEIQWRLDHLLIDSSTVSSQEASQSPLHSPRKSVTPEDTAIDEDNCDTCDENENRNTSRFEDEEDAGSLNHRQSPSASESSPSSSIISSTTTNENENRGSVDSNLLPHSGSNQIHGHDDNPNLKTFHHQNHSNIYIPSSNATPLPGISTILKGTL